MKNTIQLTEDVSANLHYNRGWAEGYKAGSERREEIASLQIQLEKARKALEYYAEAPPRHTYYIVEAKDRSFLSDMADWGEKARKALAELAETTA